LIPNEPSAETYGPEDLVIDLLLGKAAARALNLGAEGIAAWRAAKTAAEGVRVGEFTLTRTVAGHMDDLVSKSGPFLGEPARPYLNSVRTIREIIAAGKPIPDPGGIPGALRYDVPGAFRGSQGVWELVVDPVTRTIFHFNFVGAP
jgi:hypothetical protein